jgi:hypothetical protein
MPTKTPSKGKKVSAPKDGAVKPKAARAPKVAKPPEEAEGDELDGDEDEDDEDDERPAAKSAAPAAKKPVPAKPKTPGSTDGPEPPAVVPARRLTPEAKAKVNEMVQKGMPLGEALKIAASWETFVAPVKDEPAKLVQGRSFDGTPRPPRQPREEDEGPGELDGEEPTVEAEE